MAALESRARRRGIPLVVLQAPPGYPWGRELLLVRPDQHIAWRASGTAEIDLGLVTGHSGPRTRPARPHRTERWRPA